MNYLVGEIGVIGNRNQSNGEAGLAEGGRDADCRLRVGNNQENETWEDDGWPYSRNRGRVVKKKKSRSIPGGGLRGKIVRTDARSGETYP